ncbi:MAG: hypothetical protein LUD72_00525 [Bacteroidales bacterium]|nr:hypothetical protein [Bacteroidales bacterium]
MNEDGMTPFDRLMAGKNEEKSILDGTPTFTVSGGGDKAYNGFIISAVDHPKAGKGDKKFTGIYIFIVVKHVTENIAQRAVTYVYIGQSDNLGKRIQTGNHAHVKGLDEGDRTDTIVVASSGFDLSKDQREYIEARIFDMAGDSGHYGVLTQRVNVSDSPKKKKEELEVFLKNLAYKLKLWHYPVYDYKELPEE